VVETGTGIAPEISSSYRVVISNRDMSDTMSLIIDGTKIQAIEAIRIPSLGLENGDPL
jgi:hypothetical protein